MAASPKVSRSSLSPMETGIAEEFFIKPTEYMSIEPAVHIDPEGHDVYSGSLDALRLVSVPLDVNNSLQALHQLLELKHHTARSLEHSRQLLLCYLAGQQEVSYFEGVSIHIGDFTMLREVGPYTRDFVSQEAGLAPVYIGLASNHRVGCAKPSQVKPPTDVPVDLTKELFLTLLRAAYTSGGQNLLTRSLTQQTQLKTWRDLTFIL
ncbi:hypothetical protein OS493_039772 [Desmophyllum pertusum]|uniref:Uncharacterized protein n=1 Tax=Desmophyllum pertusum TaxID=174260 RepID=A0A9W9ZHK0_9CNID|nr:hypothetical protein OS493_039772 [Desmophyllum pertusum]